jgi:hypothetical protein
MEMRRGGETAFDEPDATTSSQSINLDPPSTDLIRSPVLQTSPTAALTTLDSITNRMDIDMSLDEMAAATKKPSNPRPTGSRTNSGPRRSNGADSAPRAQAPYSVSNYSSRTLRAA